MIISDNLWLNSNKNLFNIDSLVEGGLTLAEVGGDKREGEFNLKCRFNIKI